MADKKIFKKTVSDKLKKGLVVGAALFALGGAQEAKAQGILYKIGEAVEEVNHAINQNLLIPTANIKHQVGRLGRNIGRLDRNTGGLVSGTAQAIAMQRAQKVVREQVEQNGTYQTSVQDFSQTSRSSSNAYLNNVRGKLDKNSNASENSERVNTTQSTQYKQTNHNKTKSVASYDAQKILNMINSQTR